MTTNQFIGFFIDIWTRIKIDWAEYRGFKTSVWNVKRDTKLINRAIYRATIKNQNDGRTYYILRNLGGGFDEVSSKQLLLLKSGKVKYFPKYRDYNHMLTQCFAIITGNKVQRHSYVETVRSIQEEELNSLKDEPEKLP